MHAGHPQRRFKSWLGLNSFPQLDIISIYVPMIYSALCVMFLMRANPLRGQVRGVGPWKSQIFWAPNGTLLMAQYHLGPKTFLISRAQPHSLALVMDLPASKKLHTGQFKS